MRAFGADLGVDLSKRVFYDWVVVENARAQIPEPWVACSDDGGRTFYHGHHLVNRVCMCNCCSSSRL